MSVSSEWTVVGGLVYPGFGIVFAKAISSFSLPDPHQVRFQGDRNALWYLLALQVCCIL